MTFSRYVLERRLDMARLRVSRHSNRSISSIAYEVGFGDLSYFNRVFRQHFGMTPSAMRDQSHAVVSQIQALGSSRLKVTGATRL
jgi:AraC-like DNA-binding protein